MGWIGPAHFRCELNLLGRPCGAGYVNEHYMDRKPGLLPRTLTLAEETTLWQNERRSSLGGSLGTVTIAAAAAGRRRLRPSEL